MKNLLIIMCLKVLPLWLHTPPIFYKGFNVSFTQYDGPSIKPKKKRPGKNGRKRYLEQTVNKYK